MEELLINNLDRILTAIVSLCAAIISVTTFLKSLKSERRTREALNQNTQDVQVTRQGIVQAFKDAVVTKDVKVSINAEVQKILNEFKAQVLNEIRGNESKRTQMVYWSLKILEYTAAANKLTKEQRTELNEILAMIKDEERIIDTSV